MSLPTLRSCWLLCLGLCTLTAQAQDLTVSAAASLQNVFRDLGTAFESAHPGAKVHFNFAASGVLLNQIKQGAPVDVFASADEATMDQAQAAQLIDASSRIDFAANRLVLVSPPSRAAHKSLADLQSGAVQRIALGNPASVPAGRYAEAVLKQAGLWQALQPKFVYAENVRQALNYVGRGEVEAGFVYRTDALIDGDQVRVDLVVPTVTPVLYPLAVAAPATQAALAAKFVGFVRSAAGQVLLKRHGFDLP